MRLTLPVRDMARIPFPWLRCVPHGHRDRMQTDNINTVLATNRCMLPEKLRRQRSRHVIARMHVVDKWLLLQDLCFSCCMIFA